MAGQRKSLGSLVGTADPTPTTPPIRPGRADGADTPERADEAATADRAARQVAGAASPAPPAAVASRDMTMRSWYMPKASADRLAALINDVHFETRLPKHLIMGAIVNVLDRHWVEVEAEARSAGSV